MLPSLPSTLRPPEEKKIWGQKVKEINGTLQTSCGRKPVEREENSSPQNKTHSIPKDNLSGKP